MTGVSKLQMNVITAVALTVVFLLGVSCSRSTDPAVSREVEDSGRLVEKFGTFKIEDTDVVVRAWEVDGILHYEARIDGGNRVIRSTEEASVFSRWMLYWAEDDRLWIYSGDIGSGVWSLREDGTYVQDRITPESIELIRAVPSELYAKMGQSTHRRWDPVRKRKPDPGK